jgi:hypothetical protein
LDLGVVPFGAIGASTNVDNIDFIKAHGQTSTIYFSGGQETVINASLFEAVGMMQDAKQTPRK